MARPQHNRRTRRHARAAYTQARDLGPIVPARDVTRDTDGVPLLADGQVYVTPSGARYHPAWCQVIGDAWDRSPASVIVTALEDVGERTECGTCQSEGPITDTRAPDRPTASAAARPPIRATRPSPTVLARPAPQPDPSLSHPALTPGHVYVTTGGRKYHRAWCSVVNGTWQVAPHTLQVIPDATVGDRTLCRICEGMAAD